MPHKRLVLFIDDKNIYQGARRAFFSNTDPHYFGQVNPIELGKLICSRAPSSETRILHQVRIYTGSPDATKQPQAYAAHSKQRSEWLKLGAAVISRTLKYPLDWPTSKPEQKGVDVAMAVDFVTLGIDLEYDVGVIASTDTDLKPAIEYVNQRLQNKCKAEVLAWTSAKSRSRLSIPGSNIWCYWLDLNDYNRIADLTDYNR